MRTELILCFVGLLFIGCNSSDAKNVRRELINQLYTINSYRDAGLTTNNAEQEDAITNFEDRVSSGETLVEFSAPWCSVCKQQAPMVASLMDGYPHMRLIEVNVDENPSLTARYQVAFVPTFKFFRNGILVGTTGYSSTDELERFVQMGMF